MVQIDVDFFERGSGLWLQNNTGKVTLLVDGSQFLVKLQTEAIPIAYNSLDSIYAQCWLSHQHDVLGTIEHLMRYLKVGGEFIILDYVLPNKEKDARYVRAFQQLRSPNEPIGFSEYDWRGFVLDAGLRLKAVNPPLDAGLTYSPTRLPLLPLAHKHTAEEIERLQVMLLRAPQTVAKWLASEYAGTEYATFQQHFITLVAHKVG